MLHKIQTFFGRLSAAGQKQDYTPQPLRIEGITTEITPEPDDAEIAAQALLESSPSSKERGAKGRKRSKNNSQLSTVNSQSGQQAVKDIAYYQRLAERVKEGRAMEARQATRYVAYCEQELIKVEDGRFTVGNSQLSALEQELYRRKDIVEREGGELLRRWQHCLAECVVRQMQDNNRDTDKETTTDEEVTTTD